MKLEILSGCMYLMYDGTFCDLLIHVFYRQMCLICVWQLKKKVKYIMQTVSFFPTICMMYSFCWLD